MQPARLRRHVPVSWCTEHGDAVGPLLERHAGGGLRCAALARRTKAKVARGWPAVSSARHKAGRQAGSSSALRSGDGSYGSASEGVGSLWIMPGDGAEAY
ncbi:hypothetical protein SSAG_00882 [Streptomyces sp. Mg1]|nr:hypothetical protein SSAG_00882 [Streptomyces sp. Mg1]